MWILVYSVFSRKKIVLDKHLRFLTDVTVGSAEKNDIVIDSPVVSDFHLRLFVRKGQLLLEDLDSKEGTFIDCFRAPPKQAVSLDPRAIVMLGDKVLTNFRLAGKASSITLPSYRPREYLNREIRLNAFKRPNPFGKLFTSTPIKL